MNWLRRSTWFRHLVFSGWVRFPNLTGRRRRRVKRRRLTQLGTIQTLEERIVLFKPNTHIEYAVDVRTDLIDDGMVTIEGREYSVDPRVVEALTRYPAYYYAGAVGPDGFPDLVMGQSVIHPDSTGIWIAHVLDEAWAAQSNDDYSEAERLQILAWAYGFPTHAAGDVWMHTFVNQFSDGPFPGASNLTTEELATVNAIRHLVIEGYVGDATPGATVLDKPEGEDQPREQTAYGDVSDDLSIARELNAPHQFIYDVFIQNPPHLTGEFEEFQFALGQQNYVSPAQINQFVAVLNSQALDSGAVSLSFLSQFTSHGIVIEQLPTATVPLHVEQFQSGQVWTFRNGYDSYTIRKLVDNNNDPFLTVSLSVQSRGALLNRFIDLRRELVQLRGGPLSNQALAEPLGALVDDVLAQGQGMLRGQTALDLGQLISDLVAIGNDLITPFEPLFKKALGGAAVTFDDVEDLAKALGVAVDDYLNYWIKNIDAGLENWSQLGLAVSRALFDPQSRRDLQNRDAGGLGPDVAGPDFPDRRGEEESRVGLFETIANEIEDPNNDDRVDDSFVNQYLLPMIGVPRKIGELRAGITDLIAEFSEQVFDPVSEMLSDIDPLQPLKTWIVETVKDYAAELATEFIEERTGLPVSLFLYLSQTPQATLMDLQSLDINGTTVPLFRSTDHAMVDAYLGFTNSTHLEPPIAIAADPQFTAGGNTFTLSFHAGFQGDLKDNATFDKQTFAPYANSVTLSKLLLLQEYIVGTDPVIAPQPHTISHLLSDLIGPNAHYNFTLLNPDVSHGGNILTTVMPGVTDPLGQSPYATVQYPAPVSGDLWLPSIDYDHTFRQDSATDYTSRGKE